MVKYRLDASLDLVCGFWPPGNPDDVTTGSLSSNGGRLYFLESPTLKNLDNDGLRKAFSLFAVKNNLQRINALWGQTADGRCTLLDLVQSTGEGLLDLANGLEINADRWRVGSAVLGIHVESAEAEAIEGAAFYLTKIKNWLPASSRLEMTSDSFTYVVPFDALTVFQFSSVSLGAKVICEVLSRSERIKSVPRIKILPQSPKSLNWFVSIGIRLENFFSLFLGTSVALKAVQLFQAKDTGWLVQKVPSRQEKVDHQTWVRCESYEMAGALAKWLAVPDEQRPVEKTVLGMLRKSSLFMEAEFLGLAQALEGFGRLRFERGPGTAKRVSYAQRIEQTYDLLSLDFALKLLGERAQFVRTVVQTRNYFTHLGIRKGPAVLDDPEELFRLNQKLHAFLRCVMLIDLGISEDALRKPILYQSTKWR
jgi:hypothetical protein